MPLKVIVSGAGIAGLALAHWLERIGATTILIERTLDFQALGHYIALKGNGVEMVRRMGILAACQAHAAGLENVLFYSMSGRLLRRDRTAALEKTLGGYILVRRSDLHAALYSLVRERADIRFGSQIEEVRTTADRVEVSLGNGRSEWGDLLVGADGIHSQVRNIVFGRSFERPLGGYYIACTQTLRHGLPLVIHSYLGIGKMVNLLPVASDLVSAVIYVGANASAPPLHDAMGMPDYLLATCAGFPEEVRRVVGSIRAEHFVFSDAITQVRMPCITRGRFALIGDAAHCPTFLSGMGSSLALQDAYILAGCLARHPGDVSAAYRRFVEAVSPIAHRYHASAISLHDALLNPSPLKARLRDLVLRYVPNRHFERRIHRFYGTERPPADLPPRLADVPPAGMQATTLGQRP